MLQMIQIIPEFQDQIQLIFTKRSKRANMSMENHSIQDIKRFERVSKSIMRMYPEYAKRLPEVDKWRRAMGTLIRDQDVESMLKYGVKKGYFTLFPNATHQYCFCRISAACVWKEFCENFEDLVANGLSSKIDRREVVRPSCAVEESDSTAESTPNIHKGVSDTHPDSFDVFEDITWSTD